MPSPLAHKAPDPIRAHGAWVYLVLSILAGVLSEVGRGSVAAVFAGLGFVGVFLVASALAIYPSPWVARLTVGLVIALGSTILGIVLGADPMFLAYGAIAVFPAGAAVWFAQRHGYRFAPALAFAVVALVVAAPSAACAGGAPPALGWLLLGLLAPFFAWRTWRTRNRLSSQGGWTRAKLRQLGTREALLALAWTAAAVGVVHAAA